MVTISKIDYKNIRVNGKQVYRDMDGNWIAKVELTAAEQKALNDHVQALQWQ